MIPLACAVNTDPGLVVVDRTTWISLSQRNRLLIAFTVIPSPFDGLSSVWGIDKLQLS